MTRPANIIRRVEQFVTQYLTFANPDHPFAVALWALNTYFWDTCDALPYLCITSPTKRAGKTRLMEVLSFVVRNPRMVNGSASAMFRSIKDAAPTFFIDEAERMSSEAASELREVINSGNRRGRSMSKVESDGNTRSVEDYPTYCPKAFALIGDVNDTLRDRSIVVRMQRAEPPTRFRWTVAEQEGAALRADIEALIDEHRDALTAAYADHAPLAYLPDRDEEMWMPLFTLCGLFAPERLTDLARVSVDLTTEKTIPLERYIELLGVNADADTAEYAARLLRDLDSLFTHGVTVLYTTDVLDQLKAIPTAPWRKFRGDGLNAMTLSAMLKPLHVEPKLVKTGRKAAQTVKVLRGYRRDDVRAALAKL